MKKVIKKLLSITMALAVTLTTLIPANLISFAAGDSDTSNHHYYDDLIFPNAGAINLDKQAELVEGTTNQWDVTLTVQGKNMPAKPTEVVLVLDTSGSMNYSAGTDDSLLVCDEIAHEHTDACAICGKTEHLKHTDNCLTCGGIHKNHNSSCLICNKTEHEHSWRCYSWGELVCGKEAHEHDESCYKDQIHKKHNDSCYKDEIHEHDEDCYDHAEHIHKANYNDTTPEDGEYCYKTRMQVAKEAAKAFVSKLSTNSQISVSVVEFSKYESTVQGLTKDITKLNTAIDSLTAGGGTNIQGGLEEAKSILDNGSSSANKVVLLMSDGKPTYGYDSYGYLVGEGDEATEATINGAKNAADAINNAKYDIYSVGFDLSGTAATVLNYCGKDGYYPATGTSLIDDFNDIAAKLVYAAEDAFVVDPMGSMFNLNVGSNGFDASDYIVTPRSSTVTYDATTETLRWNIGKVVEGETISLTYRVTIDSNANADTLYPTNKKTTLYYTDAKDRDAAKDFPIPQVQIGKGVINVLGYLVNDQGQPINRDGVVVSTPEQALQLYVDSNSYKLNQQHTITAKTVSGYSLVGNKTQNITLTTNDPTQKVYFAYKVAPVQGTIHVEYYYEKADGSLQKLTGSDSFTKDVGTVFNKNSVDVNKFKSEIPSEIRSYYNDGSITSSVPTTFTKDAQTVTVVYPRQRATVIVRYYDNYTGAKLGEDVTYLTDAAVGSAIDTSSVQLNLRKESYHNNGALRGTVPTVVSNGTNVIEVGYDRIQSGLTVNYVFIGGSRPTGVNNINTKVSAGTTVNVNEYIRDFTSNHYTHIDTKIQGLTQNQDGSYTMPNGSATITITYEMEKVSGQVNHVYLKADGTTQTVTGTSTEIYRGQQYTVTDPSFNLDGIVYKLDTTKTQPTAGETTLTQDTVFTYYYVVTKHSVTVKHQYPDQPTVTDPSVSYADGTTITPSDYAEKTVNGRYKLVSRTPSDAFVLKSDAEIVLVYELEKAPLTIVHRYPSGPVSQNGGKYTIDTTITVGTVAVPNTQNGYYKVTGYVYNNASVTTANTFKMPQSGAIIYIDYAVTQVPVSVIHHYPDREDTIDPTVSQDAKSNFATSSIETKTINGRYTVTGVTYKAIDSETPINTTLNSNLNTGLTGLVIEVTYGYSAASVTVNHHYAAGVTAPADQVNGSKTVAYVGDTDVPSDYYATNHTVNGVAYKYTVSEVKVNNTVVDGDNAFDITGDHVIDIYYAIVPANVNVTHTYLPADQIDTPNADIKDPAIVIDANTDFNTSSLVYHTDNGKYQVKEIRVADASATNGYRVVSAQEALSVTESGLNITVVYERVRATGVTVYHVYKELDGTTHTETQTPIGPFYVGQKVDPSTYVRNEANYTAGTPTPSGNQTLVAGNALEITIEYTRKAASLNVQYQFIGGDRPNGVNDIVSQQTAVGSNVNVAGYELDLSAEHYNHTGTTTGALVENNGVYTMPNGTATIVITYTKEIVSANVQHIYTTPTGAVETDDGNKDDSIYHGQQFMVESPIYTHNNVVYQLDTTKTQPTAGNHVITENTTFQYYYVPVMHEVTVEHVYPDLGTVADDQQKGTFADNTSIDPANYQSNTHNGRYTLVSVNPNKAFTLKADAKIVFTYEYTDASVTVNHHYAAGVTAPADQVNGSKTVAYVGDTDTPNLYYAQNHTVNGTSYLYTVSEVKVDGRIVDGTKAFDITGDHVVDVYYVMVPADVRVTHTYLPADQTDTPNADIKDPAIVVDANTDFNTASLAYHTDNGKYQVKEIRVADAQSPNGYRVVSAEEELTVSTDGLNITVVYERVRATGVTVYHVYKELDGTTRTETQVPAGPFFVGQQVDPTDYVRNEANYTAGTPNPSDLQSLTEGKALEITIEYTRVPATLLINHVGRAYFEDGTLDEIVNLGSERIQVGLGSVITASTLKKDFSAQEFKFEKTDVDTITIQLDGNVVNIYYSKLVEEIEIPDDPIPETPKPPKPPVDDDQPTPPVQDEEEVIIEDDEVPLTGDTKDFHSYLMLLVASLAGAAFAFGRKKKEDKENV